MSYNIWWNCEKILISLHPNSQTIGTLHLWMERFSKIKKRFGLMKPCKTLLSQSTQWKGKTRNKRKGPIIGPKNKNPQPRGKKEEWEKVMYLTSLVTRNMLEKAKGGIQEKTPSLKEPSLAIMVHLKIYVMCAHCNAINTLYL